MLKWRLFLTKTRKQRRSNKCKRKKKLKKPFNLLRLSNSKISQIKIKNHSMIIQIHRINGNKHSQYQICSLNKFKSNKILSLKGILNLITKMKSRNNL